MDCILLDKIHELLIVVKSIEFKDIRMIKTRLDFDFILEIILAVVFNQCLFLNFLHCHDQASVDILRHEDFTEFTGTKMLTDFEVFLLEKIVKEKIWR